MASASRRTVLLLLLVSLTTLLLSVGLVLGLRLRTGPRVERLVRDARVLETEAFPRPSHVSPALPGTFAQALEPLRRDLSEARMDGYRLVSEGQDSCGPVISGQEPFTSLPTDCAQALERWRTLVRHVLEATRAEQGGLPRAEREPMVAGFVYWDLRHALPSTMPVNPDLLFLARLAALEIRFLVDWGQKTEAVDVCLDALALGREMTLGSGVEGRLLSAKAQELAYPPCAAALAAAPVERQRQALEQLTRLRQGWPALDHAVRAEAVACQLYTYGGLLSPEQLDLLPPAARSIAEGTGFRWDENVGSQLMARDMWRLTSEWFEAMEMAATRPATELRTAFLDVDAHFRSQKWLMAPPLIEPYVELAEKSASQALQLDALLELVRTHVETHSRPQPK
ncbi:MAG TPA: hypothetical protein VEY88_13180 [Archangium sp.]|nr:hypothetical protein [Archangium sp.]